MKSFIFTIFIGLVFTLSVPTPSQAASQNACAIWLCLPGGFPSGCSGAYKEFKHRIKKGRSPLPKLSSCTTGPNGERVDGKYELGFERYESCENGFVLREPENGQNLIAQCFNETCAPQKLGQSQYQPNRGYNQRRCESYDAIRRAKPQFVKMWVDGEYLGQYFY